MLHDECMEDSSIDELYEASLIEDLKGKKFIISYPTPCKCSNIRIMNKEFPLKRVFLEISKKCNLYCQHCYANASGKEEDSLSYEKICSLIDEAAELGAYTFQITGGEPFLREDINDIIRYLWKKGFLITVYSNLTVLSEENLKTIVECAVHVNTSLDYADADKHDQFRGKRNAFEETIANIKKVKSKTDNIAVNIVVNNKTDEEINKLINFIKFDLKLNYHADVIKPIGRGKDYKLTQHDIEAYVYANYICSTEELCHISSGFGIQKDLVYGYNCNAGKDFIFVNCAGECSLCPTLTLAQSQEFYFGNILNTSLYDIWASQKRVSFSNLNCKHIDTCPKASQCKGSCRSKAYEVNKNVFDPDLIMCKIYDIDVDKLSLAETAGGK